VKNLPELFMAVPLSDRRLILKSHSGIACDQSNTSRRLAV